MEKSEDAKSFQIVLLSKKQILKIHESQPLLQNGVLEESNLEFLVNTVGNFFDSLETRPKTKRDLIELVASYYLFHLVSGHIFYDGNKRTAFLSTTIFLMLNDCIPKYSEEKVRVDLEKIYAALEKNESFIDAMSVVKQSTTDTPEFQLVILLFELAGADPNVHYSSPIQIRPILAKFIDELNEKSLEENHDQVGGFLSLFKDIFKPT